ncbi:hypothetical protein IJ732_03655 [bacterium]|nr:hypothetical protein [bacterium]
MLEKEYKYYNENKSDFIDKYLDKHIVIKNNEVLGVYNSLAEAIQDSLQTNDLGTFLVKHIEKEEQAVRFYNRVFV